MSKTKNDTAINRRGFLKGVGTGAAGAATVATGVNVAAGPAEAAENAADKKKARYKETEHVKKFYQTNRYL